MPISVTMVPAEASALITSPVEKFFTASHPLRAGTHDRDERADGAGGREDPRDHDCLHVMLLAVMQSPVTLLVSVPTSRYSPDFAYSLSYF